MMLVQRHGGVTVMKLWQNPGFFKGQIIVWRPNFFGRWKSLKLRSYDFVRPDIPFIDIRKCVVVNYFYLCGHCRKA